MIWFNLILFLFYLTSASSFVIHPKATGCSISISSLDPEPIVVWANSSDFIYADPSASTVAIDTGATIIISCPGGQISAGGTQIGPTIEATCISNTKFSFKSVTIDFAQITCSRKPFHTARYTGNSCESNGKEIEVGFVLTDDEFARQLTICFDETNLNTLYSSYDLTASIGHHESGVSRPSFIEDDFYQLGVKVNDLYVRGGQQSTINGLLGLAATSTKYIKDSGDYYLSRGHLSAKADFVYAPQQTATFHYVNAAPQWQTFNGVNWEKVESSVRDYAETNQLDLKVYTGTYGVATLPHEETGEDTPLYLYVDGNTQKIPVPELYWKVVYNPESKQGVALLGINNPYQTDVEKSVICNDIASSLTWLSWEPHDLKAGYSYACAVDDLRRSVPFLPDFETTGILL